MEKPNGRGRFKKRDRGMRYALHGLIHLIEQGGQLVGADGNAVHLESFFNTAKMRPREQAGAAAGLAQHRASMAEVEPLPFVPATWMMREVLDRPAARARAHTVEFKIVGWGNYVRN